MVPRGACCTLERHIAERRVARAKYHQSLVAVLAAEERDDHIEHGTFCRHRATRRHLRRRRVLTRSFVRKAARGRTTVATTAKEGLDGRKSVPDVYRPGIMAASSAVSDGCGFLCSSQAPALACGRTCRFRPTKSYLVTASPFSAPFPPSCRRLSSTMFVRRLLTSRCRAFVIFFKDRSGRRDRNGVFDSKTVKSSASARIKLQSEIGKKLSRWDFCDERNMLFYIT